MRVRIGSCAGLVVVAVFFAGCGGGPEAQSPAGTPATQSSQPSQPSLTPAVQQAEAPSGSGAIAGFAYDDKNKNQAFDPTDARMAQLTVTLMNPPATVQYRSTATGADGAFRFDKLAPGDYRVILQTPPAFERTSDDSFVLSVAPDGTSREVQFGIASR